MTVQDWADLHGFQPSYYGSLLREWPDGHYIRICEHDNGRRLSMSLDAAEGEDCELYYGIEEPDVSMESLTLAVQLYCSLYGGAVCP